MNTFPRILLFFTLALIAMSAVLPGPALALEADKTKNATAAMLVWLKGIDEGKYGDSWKQASAVFQKSLTEQKWEAALDAVRRPLGACQDRKQASALHQTEVPVPGGRMLKGDFVIAQFDTSFANLKYAIETVTFELQDGVWKASGYYIKPK